MYHIIHHLKIKSKMKYIRLKQTGQSWCTAYYNNNYVFAITFIEFYGMLSM